jgi:hypothetical protein
LKPFNDFPFGFTTNDLYHSYNPTQEQFKLGRNHFNERLRENDKIIICESPLMVKDNKRLILVFFKPVIESDDEIDLSFD